jgi:hypothetical protein
MMSIVIAGLSDDLSMGARMISIALPFGSGTLFYAGAKNSVPARTYSEFFKHFPQAVR